MVINVVIRQARGSRPTSCKPRVLYRPILTEDLYLEFILFNFLICFINLLLYIYGHVCYDDDDDYDGKSPEYRKTPPFFHILDCFCAKWQYRRF